MYFVVLSGSVVGCTTLSVAPMLAHSVMVCRVCSSILCLKVGTLFRRSTQPSNFNSLLRFQSWFAEFLDIDNVLHASCESHFHWKSSRYALILCCVSCRTWCLTFCLPSGVILSLEQKKTLPHFEKLINVNKFKDFILLWPLKSFADFSSTACLATLRRAAKGSAFGESEIPSPNHNDVLFSSLAKDCSPQVHAGWNQREVAFGGTGKLIPRVSNVVCGGRSCKSWPVSGFHFYHALW